MIKVFYFRNRNELKDFIEKLRKRFLEGEGEFIYRSFENRLLLFYEGDVEGGKEAYIFNSFEEIPEIIKKLEFKSFAVRSRRMNSNQDNRVLGEIIKERLNKNVDLENPDITLVVDEIGGIKFFFIK
ncbi:MAG: THUMP domain-containing protein [Thermoplasmata archaeon]|jgi:thermostable 8-oxoguanine DNA glycosylase|nr:hypothetical protein [Thermoplasmatales archaeon]PMP73710.1 MAG: hypothetical protein C0180_06050 [Aciduliprofundum sp.]